MSMSSLHESLFQSYAVAKRLADHAPAMRVGITLSEWDGSSGETLLQSIGFPHQGDANVVAAAYPWLPDHTQPGCSPPFGPAPASTENATALMREAKDR